MTDAQATPENSAFDPEKIREAAADAAETAAKWIKKHPLESVGAALLVGVLVGVLIGRK